MPSLLHASLPT